jgi:hypothetical protein
VVNFYRRHKEDRLSEFASEMLGKEDGTEEEIDSAILAGLMKEALGKLPEKDRKILRLFYEEGRSLKDIAKKEGKSENAAKLRLSRARKRLGGVLSYMTPFSSRSVNTYRRKVGGKKGVTKSFSYENGPQSTLTAALNSQHISRQRNQDAD